MNLIETLEREEIARLGKTLPEFAPGDTVVVNVNVVEGERKRVQAYEGVVIGKRARRVSQAEAMDHVFGYTVINDVSARDLQFGDKQWVRGKSLDTFCPCGPYVVTADEITHPHALSLRSTINGQVMQDSNTREMIFNVPYLVSFLSQAFTLEPGDLIATGTPNGVGVFRKPQVFLQDGDLVEVEVQGIGRLTNPVKLG